MGGKHCFGYASLVADEYRDNKDKLGLLSPPAIGWFDPMHSLRNDLRTDMTRIDVDNDDKIGRDSFRSVLIRRHEPKFGDVAEAREAFEGFLDRLFDAMCLSGGTDDTCMKRTMFPYAALLAYEFYFSDARDKALAQGCGSSTPVADNLGITRLK